VSVGSSQDWIALGVYVVVVGIVARLVSTEQEARRRAASREDAVNQLFVVSEHLIGEQPLDELLDLVVRTVHESFDSRWVALLLPTDSGELAVAATAGAPLSDADLAVALGPSGATQSLALVGEHVDVGRVALTALQRPVGQLVVAGATLSDFQRQLLGTFANEAALAIERSQLRAQAVRTELLEEVDRWRSALVGAVSHDLRTPLASIKAAVSTLRSIDVTLSERDSEVLLATIEDQGDHLARLVANLLDMARLETGSLSLHAEPHLVVDVVDAGLVAASSALADHVVDVQLDDDLPLVDVDLVLIGQVLANLLTNAAQHAPDGSTITLRATDDDHSVLVSVCDEGPGVPPEDRERIFHLLDRRAGSGRAGLGLAIATAFVEAHGQRLVVGATPGGGASFSFRVPSAVVSEDAS
jgi:two-component system, OmpR family, sensor histidine kinase KdpD